MSDGNKPSGREIERDLRDLGARIEYPPTPDLAQAVRRRLDEGEGRAPGGGLWPSLLSPRWAVPAAALVLVAFALLSPAVRETLSGPFFSGQTASSGGREAVSEDGGSAARPESGGSAASSGQEAKAGSQPSRASDTGGSQNAARPESGGGALAPQSATAESAGGESAQAGAVGCPAPYLRVEPARAAPGATFRLRGNNFVSSCERIRPEQGIRIDFRQGERRWRLATVDAGRRLAFDASLRVPAGARPGRATVRAIPRSGGPVEERFLVLR